MLLSVRSKPSSWLLDTFLPSSRCSIAIQGKNEPTFVTKGFARLLTYHDGQIDAGGCPGWLESIEMRM